MENAFAVVETGGKQYKVKAGEIIDVEKLPLEAGDSLELDHVLLVATGDEVTVGKPTVPGAKVRATVLAQDRGKKIIVFKYKSKVRYRRKLGHRQDITRLQINEIVV